MRVQRPLFAQRHKLKPGLQPAIPAHILFEASRNGYHSNMSNPTTSILDQVLDPFTECLTPEVAQRIVALRADAQTQARVDELADKANEGQLTEAERAEYDKYREAFHFVTILQAKARTFLDRQAVA